MSQFFLNKDFSYINRFDIERFMNFTNQYHDVLQSPMLEILKSFPPIGQYLIREYPYRPDVISYNIYKEAQFWPYILLFNGINDVMQLKLGTTVNFFSLNDLEQTLYTYSNFNDKLQK